MDLRQTLLDIAHAHRAALSAETGHHLQGDLLSGEWKRNEPPLAFPELPDEFFEAQEDAEVHADPEPRINPQTGAEEY